MKCTANNILYICIIIGFIYMIGNDIYKYFTTERYTNGNVLDLDLNKPTDYKKFEQLIEKHKEDPLISSLISKDTPSEKDLIRLKQALNLVVKLNSDDDSEISILQNQIKDLEQRLSIAPKKSKEDNVKVVSQMNEIQTQLKTSNNDEERSNLLEELKSLKSELKSDDEDDVKFLTAQLKLVVDKLNSIEKTIDTKKTGESLKRATDEESEDTDEESEATDEESEDTDEESEATVDQIKSIHVYENGAMKQDDVKSLVMDSLRELKGPASNPTCYGEYEKDCVEYKDTGAAWLTFASGVDVTNRHVSIYNDKKYSNVNQCLNDLKKEGLYPDYVGIRKGPGQTSAYENTCYYYNDTDGTDFALTPFENTADKSFTFMKKVPAVKSSLLWWKEVFEKVDPALLESDISILGLVFKYKNGSTQTIKVGQPLVLESNPMNILKDMINENKNNYMKQFELLSDSINSTNDALNTQFNTKLDSVNTQFNTKLDGFESSLERFGKNVMKELQPPRTNPPSKQDLYTKQFGGITSVNSDYVLNKINNVKYVMLQMQRQESLHISNIQFYEASRQIIQELDSTMGYNGEYAPPLVNDPANYGIRNTHDGNQNSFGHTDSINLFVKCPYFMYKLPSSPALDSIKISNRTDCCQDRLEGTAIILLNKDYIPLKQLIISKSNWSNSNSWVGVGLTREYNIKEFVDFDYNNACLQTIKTLQDQVKHGYKKVNGSWLIGQSPVDIPDKNYSSIHECIHELKSEGKSPDFVGLRTTYHGSMPHTCYYYENIENPKFAPLDGQHTLMRKTNKKGIGREKREERRRKKRAENLKKAIKSIF